MTTNTEVSPLGRVVQAETRKLKPYEGNPRRIPTKAVEQTAKSIREFGWQQPIVVDPDFVIVAGHTRHAAAVSLGLKLVPVVVAENLSPAQVRAFRVADNRAHDYAAWDYTMLVEELNQLGAEFSDVLDVADWSALLAAFGAEDDNDDPDPRVGPQLLPEEASGQPIQGTGFVLGVEFASQEDADRAGPELLKIPGVLNVRHSRT
jgi:hypothetical protein